MRGPAAYVAFVAPVPGQGAGGAGGPGNREDFSVLRPGAVVGTAMLPRI